MNEQIDDERVFCFGVASLLVRLKREGDSFVQ